MGVISVGGKVLTIGGGVASRDPILPQILPSVSVDSPASVEEGTGNIVFTVTISAIASEDVTVDYATSNGTALAGTNYTAKTGTLTIPAGQATGTVTVTVLNPSGYHGTTQFTLTLSNAAHNGDELTIIQATGTGTILDNEASPAAVTVSVNSPSAVEEGTGNITFTITLSEVAAHDVTVDYATANGTAVAGTNYTSASGTKTITQGQTTGTVVVTVLNPAGYHGATTFTLTLSNALSNGSALTITTDVGTGTINDDELPTGDHGYFDALVARSDHWKSYSLRSSAQLVSRALGGYSISGPPYMASYDPGSDTWPTAQDACKIEIPSWTRSVVSNALLKDNIGAGDTTIYFNESYLPLVYSAPIGNNHCLKIDDEVMSLTSTFNTTTKSVTVSRGAFGTTAASHTSGTPIYCSINTMTNYLRMPLVTSDGHTYLFTWDVFMTDTILVPAGYAPTGYKWFQLCSGGNSTPQIWLEPQLFLSKQYYDDNTGFTQGADAGFLGCRSYNVYTAPTADWADSNGDATYGTISVDPLMPRAATGRTFIVKPNVWTRLWVLIDQRANDWDYMSMWIADETRDPVHFYDNVALSVRTGGSFPNSIRDFFVEFNTSSDGFCGVDSQIAYVKNFAALIDPPSDLSTLLVKP